jgi:hypothetical protein
MEEQKKSKLNIFAKMQKIRVELQKCSLKKSGKNKFAGYEYFELGDFLPKINELCNEIGLMPKFDKSNEEATLEIFDIDSEKTIIFNANVKDAPMKGALPIQCLGAEITYMRRYLYMMAFEIIEADAVDSLPDEKKEIKAPEKKAEKVYKEITEHELEAVIKSISECKKFKDGTEITVDNCKKHWIISDKQAEQIELVINLNK